MKTQPLQRPRMGILLRTALWSWLITLTTLAVFSFVTIPQQKRVFLQNLESKAHGVAVSLRDVAAGSVVTEDFSSVVDYCNQMLAGDPALDFIVVTKNDGFSLVSERSGWRTLGDAGREWRPLARRSSGAIGVVPLFNRRAFHFSQPFDYSGIEWGWIHIGLSLQSYDRSVTDVYRRTGLLAIGCILFSMVASAFYARQQVRPILDLRNIVQRVAGGDLSARAAQNRNDELGTLAGSVNAMTEALLRRDRILQSVRFAAQRFLSTTDWAAVLGEVLAQIGEAAMVSRIRVLVKGTESGGVIAARCQAEWRDPGQPGTDDRAAVAQGYLFGAEFLEWAAQLRRGEAVSLRFSEQDERRRGVMARFGAKAVLMVPIDVDGLWWGALSLVDCTVERQWTDAERDSFRAAADMLGAAIARRCAQDALLEAKETLEARVRERTQELSEEVQAKGRALAEQQRAEAILAESEERFRGLFENATVGIYRTSADGRLLLANRALLKMLRYPSFEIASLSRTPPTDFVLPEERERFGMILARDGRVLGLESQRHRHDGTIIHVRESARVIRDADGHVRWFEGTIEDITEQKEAEVELARLNQELRNTARQAGRAEIATNVLHNVGNVLNSVNVSCTLVLDRVAQSEAPNVGKLADLLEAQGGRLAEFLASDPRGAQVPAYLRSLAQVLQEEHGSVLRELALLRDRVDHIKEIVAMQQDYARVSGVLDTLSVPQLVEDSVKLNAGALVRHGVSVVREFEEVPPVVTDKHKVLQILLNLIRNAKYACDEGGREPKLIHLCVASSRPGWVTIRVKDNGVGIAPENLVKIFCHGFSTRKGGHGFGLHSGALAAKELGGSLIGESDGLGTGATFTLEIPCEPKART